MASCLLNMIKCIWSFIVGSLRMVLFFGCILVVLLQLTTLAILIQSDRLSHALPMQGVQSRDYIHVIFLLFTGLLGAYGAFYKHISSLKAFVILIFISTIVLTITMMFTMNPETMESENMQIFKRMDSFFEKYDWKEKSTYASRTEARAAWDTMQTMGCCGIHSKRDWNKYRPHEVSDDLYPSSCCRNMILAGPFEKAKLCESYDVYEVGCLDRLEQIEAIGVLLTGVYISFQTILFFIGLVSLAPNSSCISDSSSRNVEETHLTNNHVPQAYQKLDHSVYIRQPILNSYPHLVDERQRVYPDLNKSGYSTPPPSYGASS